MAGIFGKMRMVTFDKNGQNSYRFKECVENGGIFYDVYADAYYCNGILIEHGDVIKISYDYKTAKVYTPKKDSDTLIKEALERENKGSTRLKEVYQHFKDEMALLLAERQRNFNEVVEDMRADFDKVPIDKYFSEAR